MHGMNTLCMSFIYLFVTQTLGLMCLVQLWLERIYLSLLRERRFGQYVRVCQQKHFLHSFHSRLPFASFPLSLSFCPSRSLSPTLSLCSTHERFLIRLQPSALRERHKEWWTERGTNCQSIALLQSQPGRLPWCAVFVLVELLCHGVGPLWTPSSSVIHPSFPPFLLSSLYCPSHQVMWLLAICAL